jgi:O-antigen/teichoic acid export membrane protein
MIERFFRSRIFITTAGEVALRLGVILSLFILYPVVGGAFMGPILVFYGCVTVAWVTVDLGLGIYGSRIVALGDADLDEVSAEICLARIVLLTLSGGVLFIYGWLILNYSLTIILPQLIYLFCKALSLDWRFRGEEKFVDLMKVGLLSSSVQLVIVVVSVMEGEGEQVAVWLWAIPSVLMLSFSIFRYPSSYGLIYGISPGRAWKHLHTSCYISASNGLSVVVQQSPVVFLPFFIGGQLLGEVALVHRICFSVVFLFQMVGTAFFPSMVREAKLNPGKLIAGSLKSLILIFIISSFISFLLFTIGQIEFTRLHYLKTLDEISLLLFCFYVVLRSVRVIINRLVFAVYNDKVYAKVMVITSCMYAIYLVCVALFSNNVLVAVLVGYLCFEAVVLILGLLGVYFEKRNS